MKKILESKMNSTLQAEKYLCSVDSIFMRQHTGMGRIGLWLQIYLGHIEQAQKTMETVFKFDPKNDNA